MGVISEMALSKTNFFKPLYKIPLLIVVAGFFVLSSFSKTDYKDLNKLNWLLGKWEVVSSKHLQFEEWKKISKNKFEGISYKVIGNDTIISETLELVILENNIFYIPTVYDQNNAQPIKFKISTLERGYVSFENKEHDFPKKIEYFLESKREIKAIVSNESFSIDFHLSKQKN